MVLRQGPVFCALLVAYDDQHVRHHHEDLPRVTVDLDAAAVRASELRTEVTVLQP